MLKQIKTINTSDIQNILVRNDELTEKYYIYCQECCIHVFEKMLADSYIYLHEYGTKIEPIYNYVLTDSDFTKYDCIAILESYFDGTMNNRLFEKFYDLQCDGVNWREFLRDIRKGDVCDTFAISEFNDIVRTTIDNILMGNFDSMVYNIKNVINWISFCESELSNEAFLYIDTDTYYVYNLKSLMVSDF